LSRFGTRSGSKRLGFRSKSVQLTAVKANHPKPYHTPPWTPPKGIRYRINKGRPTPFVLAWSQDGKEHSKAYATEEERELVAKDLAVKLQRAGDAVLEFNEDKWKRYLEFQKIVGQDVDPILAAHEWRAARQGTPKREGLFVAEAVTRYFALRKTEKSWGVDAERHAKKHLDRFIDRFGTKKLFEVDSEEVRTWLDELKTALGSSMRLARGCYPIRAWPGCFVSRNRRTP
jgi:hypothetical protein